MRIRVPSVLQPIIKSGSIFFKEWNQKTNPTFIMICELRMLYRNGHERGDREQINVLNVAKSLQRPEKDE